MEYLKCNLSLIRIIFLGGGTLNCLFGISLIEESQISVWCCPLTLIFFLSFVILFVLLQPEEAEAFIVLSDFELSSDEVSKYNDYNIVCLKKNGTVRKNYRILKIFCFLSPLQTEPTRFDPTGFHSDWHSFQCLETHILPIERQSDAIQDRFNTMNLLCPTWPDSSLIDTNWVESTLSAELFLCPCIEY